MGIREYPAIIWMKKGEIFEYYKGDHDVESLKTYVYEMMQPHEYREESSSIETDVKESSEESLEIPPDNESSESTPEEEPISKFGKESDTSKSSDDDDNDDSKDESKSESSEDSEEKNDKNDENDDNDEEESSENENSAENSAEKKSSEESDEIEETSKAPTSLIQQFVMKSKPKFLELSAGNISENLNPSGVSFIMLYAPWCDFCSELRSILKKIALKNGLNPAITIGEINCMQKDNKEFCFDHNVQGVPTLNLYRNGELLLSDYRGTTLDEIEDCIMSHLTEKGIRKWNRHEAKRKLLTESETSEFVKELEPKVSENSEQSKKTEESEESEDTEKSEESGDLEKPEVPETSEESEASQ